MTESYWDDDPFPKAYLLTFRTYGTWHHGDNRGSVDRSGFNKFNGRKMAENHGLEEKEAASQKALPFLLNREQRRAVYHAIREVCRFRDYAIFALNVRTNHIHVVVSAQAKPEKIIEAFKSYATRRLRSEGLVSLDAKVWARHGSTRYLWKDRSVNAAIEYVLHGQGEDVPEIF
jgi:REP element-mobilizing transposase RayT